MELFALYDITGNRTEKGQHQKDPEATNRAEQRKQTSRCAKSKKRNVSDIMAITKPTLDEEIKLFKAIVRHVMKHEVKQGKGKWFRMDNRSNLRRLNDLGVSGHQPAIMAFCQLSKWEKRHRSQKQFTSKKLPITKKQKRFTRNIAKGK